MKKIAIIQLKPSDLVLTISAILDNENYLVLESYNEHIKAIDDFESDLIIKASTIESVTNALKSFIAIIHNHSIDTVYAMADYAYSEIINATSFFDQLENVCDVKFSILPIEKEIDYHFLSCVNHLSIAKGLCLYVGEYNTYLIHYNRRCVIEYAVIDYGACNSTFESDTDNSENKELQIYQRIFEKVNEIQWIKSLEEDLIVVGCGPAFNNVASLNMKMEKYPYHKIHGYRYKTDDFNQIYSLFKDFSIDKTRKIKGITNQRADVFVSSLIIIKAILDNIAPVEILTNSCTMAHGYTAYIASEEQVKPFMDSLDSSLSAINQFYNGVDKNIHLSTIASSLFRQLKVMHRLGKEYSRVLKIATRMIDCGKRIEYLDNEKMAYYVLVNSTIYGASHEEIILSAFTLMSLSDSFRNSEWNKYQIFFGDEQLESIKKLSVIMKIASATDKFDSNRIQDITCDILGDCVIIKTIATTGYPLELRECKKLESEFKKVFGKSVEIL